MTAEARLDAGVAAGGVVDALAHGLLAQRAAQLVGGDAVDGTVECALPQRLLVLWPT